MRGFVSRMDEIDRALTVFERPKVFIREEEIEQAVPSPKVKAAKKKTENCAMRLECLH